MQIATLVKTEKSNKKIAEMYDISATAICNIRLGKRWGYITGILPSAKSLSNEE